MKLSYWEQSSWLDHIDYTIVGSGIVGLTCALRLRERFPTAKICILEKGILPQGASTKNAGFACFGSISEILDDLKSHTKAEVISLIEKRVNGLARLRSLLGDDVIDYQELGGYELFTQEDKKLYEACLSKVAMVNEMLLPIFKEDIYESVEADFGYQNIQSKLIFNKREGQIDTGKMMRGLLRKAYESDIQVLNNCRVLFYTDKNNSVAITTDHFTMQTKKLLIATNGFANSLDISGVRPARAQVLITKPIPDLKIKGTFHLDQGYYYFRNIDNRILLGGGRNLDFKTEETTEMVETEIIQNELERLLRDVILPNTNFEVDYSWSGIMGVGAQKKPVVKKLTENTFCGVRLRWNGSCHRKYDREGPRRFSSSGS